MSYDFRDFLFDFSKEGYKQSQQFGIHQQCEALRQRAAQLPEKDCEEAFRVIDEYEQKLLQNVEVQATNASITKEILKRFGF